MREQLTLNLFDNINSKEINHFLTVEELADEIKAYEMYREVFRLGENMIQRNRYEKSEFKANPILLYKNKLDDKTMKRKIMFEDHFKERLEFAQERPFAIMNGVAYLGRNKTNDNAHKMYAMIFDIDDVEVKQMKNLFSGFNNNLYPLPSYLVLSGGGVHLYYVFDEPISLYPHVKTLLKELKFKLTDKMWNMYTSKRRQPEHQGISQGFRVAGGLTKKGNNNRVFKLRSDYVTLEYLHSFLSEEDRKIIKLEDINYAYKTEYTLEEAKEKFPEWYEKVILNKDKSTKKWSVKRDLYDWWKRKIQEGASFGHRYFCIMCLAIYAIKCDVTEQELREDAYELIPFLNALNTEDPFTAEDVESALESYDLRYKTFPRKDISKLSAIDIKVNKRNGRKRKEHVKIMNAIREITHPDGSWINRDGAPTKEKLVHDFLEENSNLSVTEIARRLGVSRNTVYKHKKTFTSKRAL